MGRHATAATWCRTRSGLPSSFEPGRRDPKGNGIDLATAKNVKWVARLGSMNCSTPAVVDGRVFIGAGDDGQGLFLCLGRADGPAPLAMERAAARRSHRNRRPQVLVQPLSPDAGRLLRRRPSTAIGSTLSPIDSKSSAWTSRAAGGQRRQRNRPRRRSCG